MSRLLGVFTKVPVSGVDAREIFDERAEVITLKVVVEGIKAAVKLVTDAVDDDFPFAFGDSDVVNDDVIISDVTIGDLDI